MEKYLVIIIILTAFTFTSNAQPAGWSIQPSPSTQNLRGIAFSSVNTWIAVGDAGKILRSSDAGITWTNISSPVPDALRAVSLHGNIGLAVGISGRIIRTTDGGLNWIAETRPTTKNLYSVSMSNSLAVITGEEGTILVSLDDGLTWVPNGAGTASILFGVSVNGSTAVAVGGQGVVAFGGAGGWGLTVPGSQLTFFYSTSFVTGSTGWAVGSTAAASGNVIIHSTDFGAVWTSQTAPTTEQLFGVSFPTINLGTAVGGNGTIIHTSDGGLNWVNQTSGTSQILNAVSFADTQLGIAVGNGGTILRTTTNGVITSVDENLFHNKITLYPNPANDFITLNIGISTNDDLEINIYNILGDKVRSEMAKENYQNIYIGDLNSGIYLVSVKSKSLTVNQRLIIRR